MASPRVNREYVEELVDLLGEELRALVPEDPFIQSVLAHNPKFLDFIPGEEGMFFNVSAHAELDHQDQNIWYVLFQNIPTVTSLSIIGLLTEYGTFQDGTVIDQPPQVSGLRNVAYRVVDLFPSRLSD